MNFILVATLAEALLSPSAAFLSKSQGASLSSSKSQSSGAGATNERWNWELLNKKVPGVREPLVAEKQTSATQSPQPSDTNPAQKAFKLNQNPNFVPIDILSKLKRVKNMEDFMTEFKPHGVKIKGKKEKGITVDPEYSFTTGGSSAKGTLTSESKPQFTYEVEVAAAAGVSSDSTTSSVEVHDPPPTGCIPRDTLIEAPQPHDMSAVLWPACVYAKQCGGCCVNVQFQECVPTAIQKVPTMFFSVPLNGVSDPAPVMIDILHHASCGCECRVKAADCIPTQTYDSDNCQCICTRRPVKCSSGKQWSTRACDCVCAERYSCSARFVWNDDVCKCGCPKQTCPPGSMRDPSTCICATVVRSSVSRDSVAATSTMDAASVGEKAGSELTSKRWDIWDGLEE